MTIRKKPGPKPKEAPKETPKVEDVVTKEELNKFREDVTEDIKSMLTVFTKNFTQDVVKETIVQDVPVSERIEQASESVLSGDQIELEKFMNEPVTILVHESTNPEDLTMISPNVNGQRQDIFRGRQITVKRMFVEALARCANTEFIAPHGIAIENSMDLVSASAPSYPFSVYNDTPQGTAWLGALLKEARG